MLHVGTATGRETPCDRLDLWVGAAVAGFPGGVPSRVSEERLPAGPAQTKTQVVGGKRPEDGGGVEFAVMLVDSTTDMAVARRAWMDWVDGCMRAGHPAWEREETDLDVEIAIPASKAVGQFPQEAYIREDAVFAGALYRHAESRATLELVTDPTAIASRSAEAGYHGPPVVMLIRIAAGQ